MLELVPFEKAVVGLNCNIHATAVIYDNVTIGNNVTIGAYCILGSPPEHRDFYYAKAPFGVRIGDGARLSPFVTVDAGTTRDTWIQERAVIFQKSHLAHDCVVGVGATVGGQVSLAGHTIVMEGANVSGHSCSFQRVVIGAYAFTGGHAFITRNVPPGEKWLGYNPRYQGLNDTGLRRAGITHDQCLQKYKDDYERFVLRES